MRERSSSQFAVRFAPAPLDLIFRQTIFSPGQHDLPDRLIRLPKFDVHEARVVNFYEGNLYRDECPQDDIRAVRSLFQGFRLCFCRKSQSIDNESFGADRGETLGSDVTP